MNEEMVGAKDRFQRIEGKEVSWWLHVLNLEVEGPNAGLTTFHTLLLGCEDQVSQHR